MLHARWITCFLSWDVMYLVIMPENFHWQNFCICMPVPLHFSVFPIEKPPWMWSLQYLSLDLVLGFSPLIRDFLFAVCSLINSKVEYYIVLTTLFWSMIIMCHILHYHFLLLWIKPMFKFRFNLSIFFLCRLFEVCWFHKPVNDRTPFEGIDRWIFHILLLAFAWHVYGLPLPSFITCRSSLLCIGRGCFLFTFFSTLLLLSIFNAAAY